MHRAAYEINSRIVSVSVCVCSRSHYHFYTICHFRVAELKGLMVAQHHLWQIFQLNVNILLAEPPAMFEVSKAGVLKQKWFLCFVFVSKSNQTGCFQQKKAFPHNSLFAKKCINTYFADWVKTEFEAVFSFKAIILYRNLFKTGRLNLGHQLGTDISTRKPQQPEAIMIIDSLVLKWQQTATKVSVVSSALVFLSGSISCWVQRQYRTSNEGTSVSVQQKSWKEQVPGWLLTSQTVLQLDQSQIAEAS